jgi:MarR family transcriptional regulator, 2-MHQ and catechol-resistance regulon repressor
MATHYEKGTPSEIRALDAFIKLSRAKNRLDAVLDASMNEQGLTGSQLGVLEAILHLGPMSQSALCDKLLLSGGNLTLVVTNLEKAGHVKRARTTGDRRVVVVSLTREGRRFIERIFPVHARRIAELFGALTAVEQETLGRLCKKLGLSIQSRTP